MDHERWQRVGALFHEALEREEPARTRFLDDQGASDPELRREVDRWLAADQAEPGKIARRMALMEKHPRNHAYTIAAVHAAAGNRASAVRWLEESFRRREEHMAFVAVDPMLDHLHSDPRFEALLQKMSFPGS